MTEIGPGRAIPFTPISDEGCCDESKHRGSDIDQQVVEENGNAARGQKGHDNIDVEDNNCSWNTEVQQCRPNGQRLDDAPVIHVANPLPPVDRQRERDMMTGQGAHRDQSLKIS